MYADRTAERQNVHRLDKKAVDAEKDLANLGAGLEETQVSR